jgi:hypothetical protein
MMRSRAALAVLAIGGTVAGIAAVVAAAATTPIADPPPIVKTSSLPGDGTGALGLSALQNSLLPGTASTAVPLTPPAGGPSRPDRLVNLGGLSDLFQSPRGSNNEFWTTTDRGPNGEDTSPGTGTTGFRSFPAPWFTPTLLNVRASGPDLKILRALPVVGGASCDTPVGGLPNLSNPAPTAPATAYDDPPLAYNLVASAAIPYTPSGLDIEGLVQLPDGTFWFAEEYSPSIGRIDANGCLKERIVPVGLPLTSAGALATVTKTIPAIYQLRKKNRGFEALALTPSGKYLYIGLQSPLLNPTTAAGNASRHTRILRYNLSTGTFDREYVYRFDDPAGYPRDDGSDQTARTQDMKLSALVAIDDDTLLVDERTDLVAKIFVAELGTATDILSTWDCVGNTVAPAVPPSFLGGAAPSLCAMTAANPSQKSIEQMSEAELSDNGIIPISSTLASPSKSEVAVLDSRNGAVPPKIEGIAIINRVQIAVSNDNDFNVLAGGDKTAFDTDTGNMVLRDPAVASSIIRIKLDTPLPKAG